MLNPRHLRNLRRSRALGRVALLGALLRVPRDRICAVVPYCAYRNHGISQPYSLQRPAIAVGGIDKGGGLGGIGEGHGFGVPAEDGSRETFGDVAEEGGFGERAG